MEKQPLTSLSTDDLMKQKKWLTVAIVVPAVFFTAFIVRYFIAYNRGRVFSSNTYYFTSPYVSNYQKYQ